MADIPAEWGGKRTALWYDGDDEQKLWARVGKTSCVSRSDLHCDGLVTPHVAGVAAQKGKK